MTANIITANIFIRKKIISAVSMMFIDLLIWAYLGLFAPKVEKIIVLQYYCNN
jgi:hypothetical protein